MFAHFAAVVDNLKGLAAVFDADNLFEKVAVEFVYCFERFEVISFDYFEKNADNSVEYCLHCLLMKDYDYIWFSHHLVLVFLCLK